MIVRLRRAAKAASLQGRQGGYFAFVINAARLTRPGHARIVNQAPAFRVQPQVDRGFRGPSSFLLALREKMPAVIVALVAGGGEFDEGGPMPDVGGIAGDRLKSFIERIERLEEEKRAIAGDIKEVYAEAKGTGFDTKIMRQIVRLRKRDQDEIDEEETLLDVYKRALGMLPESTPRTAEAAE